MTKEWVGDCLAQGKLLPESCYLIDLAQMALHTKLQVLNTYLTFTYESLQKPVWQILADGHYNQAMCCGMSPWIHGRGQPLQRPCLTLLMPDLIEKCKHRLPAAASASCCMFWPALVRGWHIHPEAAGIPARYLPVQAPSSPGRFEAGSGMDAEIVAAATSGSPFKAPDGEISVMKTDKVGIPAHTIKVL